MKLKIIYNKRKKSKSLEIMLYKNTFKKQKINLVENLKLLLIYQNKEI